MRKRQLESTTPEVSLPIFPGWIRKGGADTIEDAGFLSGAALAHLHCVLLRNDLPAPLLRARLALKAASTCVGFTGRPEQAGDLRDALHLTRPGDLPGPAGEIYQSWHHAVERPISVKAMHRALPFLPADQIAFWLDAGFGCPVTQAAQVLEAVQAEHPRRQSPALILADATLARALGWDHVLPILANGIRRRDLKLTGDDLRLACHCAVVDAVAPIMPLATNLIRQASRLHDVTPKLRAKGAAKAVTMFLTRDAVAPSDLTTIMSDRAARRFCDRLIELGVARELTGRDSFRLYGL